jgi:two-component system, OmpR family, sensor histidine kinase MprB
VSLRRRIVLLPAIAVAAAVALGSVVTWVSVRAQLRASVDDGLRALSRQVLTAPLLKTRRLTPGNLLDRPEDRREFLLLLPSSPLGEQDGYAQVVSSAGRIQRPPGPRVRLAAGPDVVAVAQGRRLAFFYDARLGSAKVRVYVSPFGPGQALQAARTLEDVNATTRRLSWVLLLVSLSGVGLAVLLGRWVGRAAMRPVIRLTRGTRYVAATHDLSRRVEATGDDELASLAHSFNSMLEALAESRRAQRQLVADASHELRTPLTTVQTNVELLARAHEMPEDERRQLREDLVSQLHELTGLVGDLVELARERAPESELEDLDFAALVTVCVARARSRAPGLRFELHAEPATVRADRGRLDRAVMNLLDNAAKWSPPGATVRVTLTDGELVVRDQGPGIPEPDRAHVFDRFYRAAESRGLPGSGLGLAIVRQVAEMHGGSAWAAPANARGAELHLRLPVVAGDDRGRADAAAASHGVATSRT